VTLTIEGDVYSSCSVRHNEECSEQDPQLSVAREWLRNCQDKHHSCHLAAPKWLPTRLVDVTDFDPTVDYEGMDTEPNIHIITTDTETPKYPYMTFSMMPFLLELFVFWCSNLLHSRCSKLIGPNANCRKL
jgi:hypothetical protein